MVNVLEILPGERAIVSTAGLFRVAIEPGHEVAAELYDAQEAAEFCDTYNETFAGRRAVAYDYAALAQQASS